MNKGITSTETWTLSGHLNCNQKHYLYEGWSVNPHPDTVINRILIWNFLCIIFAIELSALTKMEIILKTRYLLCEIMLFSSWINVLISHNNESLYWYPTTNVCVRASVCVCSDFCGCCYCCSRVFQCRANNNARTWPPSQKVSTSNLTTLNLEQR